MPQPVEYGFVYCIMGPERETNITGHVCIALYCTNDKGKKMVTRTAGYYAMPPNSFFDNLFNYDISGNFGWFKTERLGDFDSVHPMRAKLYKLPKNKYDELDAKCQKMLDDQQQAVTDHATVTKLPRLEKFRHHPFENNSLLINELEKERAATLRLPSRLKPFELLPPKLNNCKFQILNLLQGIIPSEEIKLLKGSISFIPRSSGQLDAVFFNGEGPFHQHQKKSKNCLFFRSAAPKTVYFREQKDSQLSIMTCPQDDKTIQLIERLKKIERLLIFPDTKELQTNILLAREALLKYVQETYQLLATAFFRTVPIAEAEDLLNAFYAAAIGEFELESVKLSEDLPFVVVPALSKQKQKQLCDILGKPYIQVAAEGDHLARIGKNKAM